MSSVAGNLRSYFPQRQFSPSAAWARKRLFWCHSQKCYRNYQSPNTHLFFFSPLKATCFFQVECSSDITGNYWNGLQKKEPGKKKTEVHQLQVISSCLSPKTLQSLFHEHPGCCISSGQKGSKVCWITRPLIRVFTGWKCSSHMQSYCKAGVFLGLCLWAGLANDVACLAFTEMIPNSRGWWVFLPYSSKCLFPKHFYPQHFYCWRASPVRRSGRIQP